MLDRKSNYIEEKFHTNVIPEITDVISKLNKISFK